MLKAYLVPIQKEKEEDLLSMESYEGSIRDKEPMQT